MILLFSSNIDGGILQFEIQLLKEINQLGKKCFCMISEKAKVTVPSELSAKVLYYKKFKTLNIHDKNIMNLVERIISLKPDFIWYMDSAILSSQLCFCLKGKINQYITIHDPAERHPTNNYSIKVKIKNFFENSIQKKSIMSANKIILLSPESFKCFCAKFPKYKGKADIFILGAHVPNVIGKSPEECERVDSPYFLFFGRIDKYKGISTLLEVYKELGTPKATLVIAGKGNLTKKEERMVMEEEKIIFINRYIEDEEMIWLFENAKATILPYIEASQSGIIPISYKFGLPVIISDVNGLRQFVDDGESGFVCKKKSDYLSAMQKLQNCEVRNKMSKQAIKYYTNHLDWCNSLKKLLKADISKVN